MSSPVDMFRALLKSAGHSVTRARLAVFRTLLAQEEPLSMHELIRQTPGVNRASIYRAVDLLERLGIVQRINTGWKYKLELTDKFVAHHHHITCVQCGRTIRMNEDELEDLIHTLAAKHKFTPTIHQIEIQGTCFACQQQAG